MAIQHEFSDNSCILNTFKYHKQRVLGKTSLHLHCKGQNRLTKHTAWYFTIHQT